MGREEFDLLGPWTSGFLRDGQWIGGSYDPIGDPRMKLVRGAFEPCGRILELGSLESGHTVSLSRWCDEVVAVEGRPDNLARAGLVLDLFDVRNARLVLGDLERMRLADFGHFDLVVCIGVLYHLPDPLRLLDEMRAVSPRLFLWTHYAAPGASGDYREHGMADPLSGLSPTSTWLSEGQLMEELGARYEQVDVLDRGSGGGDGPSGTDPAHQWVTVACRLEANGVL